MSRTLRLLGTALVTVLAACATRPIPYKEPVAVTPPSGSVAVEQTVTLVDASGSKREGFADARATLESIVAAMPDGDYQAGQIVFGGSAREETGVAAFDRATLATAAREASFLEGTSPLYRVLERDVPQALGGGGGSAAIVLISDGLATDLAGRSGAEGRTLAAARALADDRGGDVCFHTIQVGDSPEGASLLQSLAGVTDCGSYRTAGSLSTASSLQSFSRDVYLADAPAATPAAATIVDSDGDGVADFADDCAATLKEAPVDERGCWTISGLEFAVNGAEIEAGSASALGESITVLQANPDVRVRIDGHTDSDGSPAYNQKLSERRAASVRDQLVAEGLSEDRFDIKGFGETKPIVPNDSAENKRKNRRVELTILD